jgi:hypothetical protein
LYCSTELNVTANGKLSSSATTCAPRPPPSSRAINPASTSDTAFTTAAGSRNTCGEIPNSAIAIRPKNDVSGG